jgi:PPOX class probable F420-dependent enzyme
MAHVATLMKDGSPHGSPVWIAVEGDRPAIFSTEAHLKIRNLRRDPRIGISVADERNPYRSVVIRGRVVEELGSDEAIAMLVEPERVLLRDLPCEHPSG